MTPEQKRVFRAIWLEAVAAIQQAYPVAHALHTTFLMMGGRLHRLLSTTPRGVLEAELVDCIKQVLPPAARMGGWSPKDLGDYLEDEAVKRHRGRIKDWEMPKLQAGGVFSGLIGLMSPYKMAIQPVSIAGGATAPRGFMPGVYSLISPIAPIQPSMDLMLETLLFSGPASWPHFMESSLVLDGGTY